MGKYLQPISTTVIQSAGPDVVGDGGKAGDSKFRVFGTVRGGDVRCYGSYRTEVMAYYRAAQVRRSSQPRGR